MHYGEKLVLAKLHSDGSYGALGHEVNVDEPTID